MGWGNKNGEGGHHGIFCGGGVDTLKSCPPRSFLKVGAYALDKYMQPETLYFDLCFMCNSFIILWEWLFTEWTELDFTCVLWFVTEEKATAMESEPDVSRHMEQTEQTTASDTQLTTDRNPKSSDTSYAIIIKYDDSYVKSKDRILRLLHVVGCFH